METMEQWERKRIMRGIWTVIRKGIAILFVAIACILLSITIQLACDIFQEKPVYPEAEYVKMEEFTKEVIIPQIGIDENKLILESEYDYEYVFNQDQEGNPQKNLKLINKREHKLRNPMSITVKVDEMYHIVSIWRDVTIEAYNMEYYKWKGFILLCFLFCTLIVVGMAYMLWKE